MTKIIINDARIKIDEHIIIPEDIEVDRPSLNLYVGKTGSGKTILLKTLSGIARDIYNLEIRGRIIVDGKHHYIPQEPWIINIGNTGIEELIYTSFINKKKFLWIKELEQYKHILSKKISNMSYGERRILEILKSIIIDPDILFFDEPFEALDPRNKLLVEDLLAKLVDLGKIIVATAKTKLNGWKTYGIRSLKNKKIKSNELKNLDPRSSGKGRIVVRNAYIKRGKKKIRIPDMDLRPGEAISIFGSNGAGKTTILLGLSGVLKIKGYCEIKGTIGFVPDDVSMIFSWSGTKSVVRELCGYNIECYEISIDILEKLGIKINDRFFYEHSDGEKRLIILIPQLIKEIDILLIDGGLEYIDFDRAKTVEELIRRFLDDGGIVVSTIPSGDDLYAVEGLQLFSY